MTDTEYQERRNALIPLAEDDANDATKSLEFAYYSDEFHDIWNRVFHEQMNHYAREEGLV